MTKKVVGLSSARLLLNCQNANCKASLSLALLDEFKPTGEVPDLRKILGQA